MNQDGLKSLLLELENDVVEFSVIFSGKESRRVNGLYKPEKREIIIHNRNFTDENTLIYTGIHEFAHHLHFSRYPEEVKRRVHTSRFWDIFHTLLAKAEEKGLYNNIFLTDPDFKTLATRIRRDYLARNGALMKEFGQLLLEAMELCRQKNAVFEDFAERVLGLGRGEARGLIKLHTLDINSRLGFEKMKVVASIADPALRGRAEESFVRGLTPPQVRRQLAEARPAASPSQGTLQARKRYLERSIAAMKKKLADMERQLSELEKGEEHER